MGKNLYLDLSSTKGFYSEALYNEVKAEVVAAHALLRSKKGAGNDFLGWLDLPVSFDSREFEAIKKAAARIQEQSQVLLAIGIGGSYLGAKAVIDALSHSFNSKNVIFAGNNMSADYLNDLLDYIKDKDISLNVISKSGDILNLLLNYY